MPSCNFFRLVFILAIASLGDAGIGPSFGPKVTPTRGQVWPKPSERTEADSYLVLRRQNFSFKATANNCDLLEMAFTRYIGIIGIISRQIPLTSTARFRRNLHENVSGYLDTLEVELTNPCEDIPHSKMDESYKLTILKDGSTLSSPSVWGILRGLETFAQTVVPSTDGKELVIKESQTTDSPRYSHRGLLLDTSRHFIPVHSIFSTLEAMEASKMNVFHWHIVDDQSFPYQSAKFPELSNKGAYNPMTHVYSIKDINDIIEYARQRGIRVIPEFDTPGHTRSWGEGAEGLLTTCYGTDGDGNPVPDGSYGPINPIKTEAYTFLNQIFDEVTHLFKDRYVHLGGDEVDFECWRSNQEISDFMDANGLTDNYAGLEEYYIQKLVDLVKNLNASSIVWQEVFDNGVNIDPDTVVQVWISTNYKNELSKITEKGYSALLSSCWYLDGLESGGDWQRFYHCDPSDFSGTPEQKKLIIGGEACMWGEVVDQTNVVSRVWPRACAAAEKLWSSPEVLKENDQSAFDMQEVEARLEEHACRLLMRGIQAQPPNGPGYCPGELFQNNPAFKG